jgi:hypothetical protein
MFSSEPKARGRNGSQKPRNASDVRACLVPKPGEDGACLGTVEASVGFALDGVGCARRSENLAAKSSVFPLIGVVNASH